MYKCVDGIMVLMTDEEIAEIQANSEEDVVDEELSEDDITEILADHEFRLCLMELGVNEYDL